MILIAEIGNNHFGDMNLAKNLILAARDAGADLVKSQAFVASDIRSGSMPPEFYKKCQFTMDQYVELIYYARQNATDLFYSIFSSGFDRLRHMQNWHKIAASQTKMMSKQEMDAQDLGNRFISIPSAFPTNRLLRFQYAHILFASNYYDTGQQVDLMHIRRFSDFLNRPVGYSDHSIGIERTIEAYEKYGANVIEKHFTIEKNLSFDGIVFRDTVHGSCPDEFKKLSNIVHQKKGYSTCLLNQK